MGSGTSSAATKATDEDGMIFGLRSKKFQEQEDPDKFESRRNRNNRKRQETFLSRQISKIMPKGKKRWRKVSNDFSFNQPQRGMNGTHINQREFSTVGPSTVHLMRAQQYNSMYVNKSLNRYEAGYDPILAFEVDCTSLAAVLIQRLIRGHLTRETFKLKLLKLNGGIIPSQKQAQLKMQKQQQSNAASSDAQHLLSTPPDHESNERSTYPESPSENLFPSSSSAVGVVSAAVDKIIRSKEMYQEMTEMYKRLAIVAKRTGKTALALQHMHRYKTLHVSNSELAQSSPALIQTIHEGSQVLVEEYKRKAIAAKKDGNTKLAIHYMTKYKELRSLLDNDSRQELSSSVTTPPPAGQAADETDLTVQIETAKKAAINAKKRGSTTEALSHMKKYKTLIVRQRSMRSVEVVQNEETSTTTPSKQNPSNGSSQKGRNRRSPLPS
jgi:hypothetical protein